MSGLESWEDDPSVQDDNLATRTQQNLSLKSSLNAQSSNFTPNATPFHPGAQSFQPGQPYQQYGGYTQAQQYGQYYEQQQQYNSGFSQYDQQPYGQYNQPYSAFDGQQGGYTQSLGYQQQYQPQQNQQPKQTQQSQSFQTPPIIAKRPTAEKTSSATASNTSNGEAPTASVVKTLSVANDPPTPKPQTSTTEDSLKSQKEPAPPEKTQPAKAAPSRVTEASSVPEEEKTSTREVDAVAKEQVADVDEEILEEIYGKEHVNLIFIGHVDAGKSTLGGSILYATGMVDERTMDKYKREAKEAGRETWYLSWALDINKEERAKGKTVEVGRGFFETEKRRYTILDAPGHKTFVPNMIGGASQADVGILVISARKGEYETGFERGGQTREHAILAKTQGVNKLVVVINKMDDVTVEWSQARFKECTTKLMTFLKGIQYRADDIMFMPISAQTTVGIKDRVPTSLAPWYGGPSLLEYLDDLKSLERKVNAPFMMPVNAKYKDMGTIIEGKIEAGVIRKGNTYTLMPNRDEITISALYGETEDEIPQGQCGDQVRIRIRGAEEEDIFPGFVLCSPKRLVHCVTSFEAQIMLLELKSILSAGFNCVLHVHSAIEEVTFSALLHKLEKGTGRKSKKPPPFGKQGQSIIARLEVIGGVGSVCVERYEDYPQMGRFTLRDQVSFSSFHSSSPFSSYSSSSFLPFLYIKTKEKT